MASKAQQKAQKLNWLKAQLINARSLMRSATYTLQAEGVNSPRLENNLNTARLELTFLLANWNKIVWNKED